MVVPGRPQAHVPAPASFRTVAAGAVARWHNAHRRLLTATRHSPEWQQAYLDREAAKGTYEQAYAHAKVALITDPEAFVDLPSEGEDPFLPAA